MEGIQANSSTCENPPPPAPRAQTHTAPTSVSPDVAMPTPWATRAGEPRMSTRNAAPRSGRKSVMETRGSVNVRNLSQGPITSRAKIRATPATAISSSL